MSEPEDIFRTGRRGGYPIGAKGSYRVACPVCSAVPGQKCRNTSTTPTSNQTRRHAHPDRITAWKAQQP